MLYAGTFVCGVGIAVAGTLLPRLVKTYFPPERTGLVTGLYMLAMMGGAALSSAIAVPLADRLGSWQASLGSWSVVALVGALAWAPFTVRANPHHTPDEEGPGPPPVGPPHGLARRRLPRPAVLVLLLRRHVARPDLRRARLVPRVGRLSSRRPSAGPRSSRACSGRSSATAPATCVGSCCRRRPSASPGSLGIWLAPLTAPWLWAVVTGLGQGAAFSLALVLLVRYARTPEASGRLTGMAFLISYGIASIGPLAMGLVRDVTGGLSLVWAVLAAIGVVQAVVVAPAARPAPRRLSCRLRVD